MTTLPHTIIGALPTGEEIVIDEDRDERLPDHIIGSLPMRHEIKHTHFTTDGAIYSCRCGWESGLCPTEALADEAWMDHLR